MKTIVTVESFDEVSVRKLTRAAKLDAKVSVAAERRITFDRPQDMAAFLTGPRVRLLEAAIDKPRSVTELAAVLHRNRSAVSRDIRALREHGMLAVTMQVNPGHGLVAIVKATASKFHLEALISA
jgi:predicted transcriptional regulator